MQRKNRECTLYKGTGSFFPENEVEQSCAGVECRASWSCSGQLFAGRLIYDGACARFALGENVDVH